MKLDEVCRRAGLGKTMIYGMIKEGRFPRAVQNLAVRSAVERSRVERLDRRCEGRVRRQKAKV